MEYVIVLHGILLNANHMKVLASYIGAKGYSVININYPSTQKNLEELVESVWIDISSQLIENKPVHFICYSMGGLLVRAMLNKYRPLMLGRVVLIGTPNNGSEIADFFKNNWFYKKIFGPAGQQLITDQSNIKHLFGIIDYDLGIIAGSMSLDPICSRLIKEKNDGKVSINSTKLAGMKDHIIIKSSHMFLPYSKQVLSQTVYFLQHGSFFRL
jgi:pimeloyl-ACP methyl ester carboxylesterase